MLDVFLSFPPSDQIAGNRIAETLRRQGLSVFVDHALSAGGEVGSQTIESLQTAGLLVVILSANSRRDSFVQNALSDPVADRNESDIVAVMLDSSATENTVWPLVAEGEVIDLSRHPERLGTVAETVVRMHRLRAGTGGLDEGTGSTNSRPYLFAAIAVTGVCLPTILYLSIRLDRHQASGGGIGFAVLVLAGMALGMCVAHLLHRWRS